MIKNKEDYKFYLKADQLSLGVEKGSFLKELLAPDPVWKFQKLLRKLEYYINCKTGLFNTIIKNYLYLKFRKLSLKLGFTIPPNAFGPGLSIAHYGTIIINSHVKVGANCRLHAGTNIGTNAGYSDQAPTIGDNVYIAPGVKIYGKIYIPSNCALAANSVINKSFDEEYCLIGGMPAKIIKKIDQAFIEKVLTKGTELV
jgi:serine O-acetyltransferase